MRTEKSWWGRPVGAACVVLALAGVGCSGEAEAPAEAQDEGPELDRSKEYIAKVRAEATGAAAFVWEGEQKLNVTRVGGLGIDVNILSVGFEDPVVLDDPRFRFRWAFDLLKDYADEPGTFTVPAGSSPESMQSGAFLIHMKVADEVKDQPQVYEWEQVELFDEYRRLSQACTIEVGEAMDSGSLDCPGLATEDGKETGFRVSWSRVRDVPKAAGGEA